jgi:hypothetical protein
MDIHKVVRLTWISSNKRLSDNNKILKWVYIDGSTKKLSYLVKVGNNLTPQQLPYKFWKPKCSKSKGLWLKLQFKTYAGNVTTVKF